MKTKNNILSALSFFMISLSTSVNAVPSQISPESIKNIDGQRFWQSEVRCNNKTNSRYIEKQVNREQWCLQLSSTACFSTKAEAADKACSDGYDNVILATNQLTEAIGSVPGPTAQANSVIQTNFVAQANTVAPSNVTSPSTTIVPIPVQPSPSAVLTGTTNSNTQTEEYFNDDDGDDDDDTYFNIDELLSEKVDLESELLKIQQKKIDFNRKKVQLKRSAYSN